MVRTIRQSVPESEETSRTVYGGVPGRYDRIFWNLVLSGLSGHGSRGRRMDRDADVIWRLAGNFPICSADDAPVDLLWDTLPVFGSWIQEWTGSYETARLDPDASVAVYWRIN